MLGSLAPAPVPSLWSPGHERRGCPTRVQLCSAPPDQLPSGPQGLAWHLQSLSHERQGPASRAPADGLAHQALLPRAVARFLGLL